MMGNLTIATIFIVVLNVLMWMSQVSMLNINPDGSLCYNIEGSIIESTVEGQGNGTVLSNDALSELPTSAGTVVSDATNPFTDIFNNILGWLKSAPGVKYVYGVVSAPYNILKCLNLPTEFVVGVGTVWYMVSLLTLVAFLWGRD